MLLVFCFNFSLNMNSLKTVSGNSGWRYRKWLLKSKRAPNLLGHAGQRKSRAECALSLCLYRFVDELKCLLQAAQINWPREKIEPPRLRNVLVTQVRLSPATQHHFVPHSQRCCFMVLSLYRDMPKLLLTRVVTRIPNAITNILTIM